MRFLIIFSLMLAGCAQLPHKEENEISIKDRMPMELYTPDVSKNDPLTPEDDGIVLAASQIGSEQSDTPASLKKQTTETSGSKESIGDEIIVESFNFSGDVKDALAAMAKAYSVNIITEPGLKGEVEVKLSNISLDEAVSAILYSIGAFYTIEDNIVYVKTTERRIWNINYIKTKRIFSVGDSNNNVSGNNNSSNNNSSTTNTTASNSISSVVQEDEIDFWTDIEKTIRTMASSKALVIIEPMSGSIIVEDSRQNLKKIDQFIKILKDNLKKQVIIKAKIYEVTLNENHRFGINFEALNVAIGSQVITGNVGTIVSGILSSGQPTVGLGIHHSSNGNSVDAIVEALSEQGDVKIISQPKVRAMNNQPAIIRVGTQQPFFTTRTIIGSNGDKTVTEVLSKAQVGVEMAIVPQISKNGWVNLSITPRISSMTGTVTSPSGSTVPVIEEKREDTTIRLKNGETAVLGGLIQESFSDNHSKVPMLGDIPVIGNAFKSKSSGSIKKELIIFITPEIVAY